MINFKFLLENRIDFLKNYYNKKGNKMMAQFDELMTFDPTSKKVYLQWLINQASKQLILMNDLKKIKDALTVYDKHKRKFEHSDIHKYIAYEDLIDEAEELKDSKSGKEKKKDIYEKAKKESTLVYKGSEGSIYIPRTEYASCMLGRGTKWCTAGTHKNEFNTYNKEGPLYIITTRDNKKIQLHIETDECVDEQDKSIKSSYMKQKYPWVFKHIKVSEKTIKNIDSVSSMRWIVNPSERLQIAAVEKYPGALSFIDKPTEKAFMVAFSHRHLNQFDLKNNNWNIPEKAQLLLVNRNPEYIAYIKNPTERTQLAAISKKENLPVIRHIKNPTEKVQLAVISQVPDYIALINNPTAKVKKLANDRKTSK